MIESLPPPPAADELRRLPRITLGGNEVYRIYRPYAPNDVNQEHERSPWWFASVPRGIPDNERKAYGRFDLIHPHGTCYFGRTLIGSALEVFTNLKNKAIVIDDITARKAIRVVWPSNGPLAANLTAPAAHGVGVTATFFAGGQQANTQLWGEALFDADWRAVHYAASHDNTLKSRSVALFDAHDEHLPRSAGGPWDYEVVELVDNRDLCQALGEFGINVEPKPTTLPVVSLEESGLLGEM
ncbi:MAG: RES domain-containing protein [Acidimicrobiales bacterium]